jgi:transcriptional regulator with XRE-family HTH domain
MESINNRITTLRKQIGLNQTKFAQKIGVTSQLINKIELGKAKLTEPNIRLICFIFGVNEKWLKEGKGEMLDDEAMISQDDKRLLELFRKLSPRAQKMLTDYSEDLVSYEAAQRKELLETLKHAPKGTIKSLEVPQEAEK